LCQQCQSRMQLSLSNFPFGFKSLLREINEGISASLDNIWSRGEALPGGFLMMWHPDGKMLLFTVFGRTSVSRGRAEPGYQRAHAMCLFWSQMLS